MNDNTQRKSEAARWSSVITAVAIAAGAITVQWGMTISRLNAVETRLVEILEESKQTREMYAKLDRRLSYIEGKQDQ